MRRRDATTQIKHDRWRRPATLATVVSVGVHVGLAAFAGLVIVSGRRSLDNLIRVSLLAGGAGASGGIAAGGTALPDVSGSEHTAAPQPAARPAARTARRQMRLRKTAPVAPAAALPAAETAAAVESGLSDSTALGAASGLSGAGHGARGGAGDGPDQRPACVYCPEPHYPLIARMRSWQGSVDVSLSVLADGSVETASLRRSSGYGILDDAAMRVARKSRFRPPASTGLQAPLRGRIEYRFVLSQIGREEEP